MRRLDAMREAVRRFGQDARVRATRGGMLGYYPRPMIYEVGVSRTYGGVNRFRAIGSGNSWEAAFADADTKQESR